MSFGSYAGDLDAADVWERLSTDPDSLLVDVRTRPEWSFVGLPDLGSLGKEPVLAEWQVWPAMEIDARFLDRLDDAFRRRGLDRDAAVFFLCRSGVRSRAAAIAATEAGYTRAFNVAGGFEGPVDGAGHRGTVLGWKAAGLPWAQS